MNKISISKITIQSTDVDFFVKMLVISKHMNLIEYFQRIIRNMDPVWMALSLFRRGHYQQVNKQILEGKMKVRFLISFI